MRSYFNLILIPVITCSLAAAQTSRAAKPADKVVSASSANLPSEATVDSFMQQTFGYESQVSWKISSIKPAPAPGLAEVDVGSNRSARVPLGGECRGRAWRGAARRCPCD